MEKDVSPARLKRFFEKTDSTYQINRHVREMCTFARQNVTADPPFSRLDLISCRNLLIYLAPDLHKRCLPQFHHALNPGGYLILGPSESVGPFEELFDLADKRNKIYVKKLVKARPLDVTAYPNFHRHGLGAKALPDPSVIATRELQQVADRIMLSAYAPAAVVVDENLHLQQFRGRTDVYLEHAPGPATLDLFQLVRPSLVADLRAAIHHATKEKKPVRKERALIKYKGSTREVNLQVVPFRIAASDKLWLLIIFDETTKGTKPGKIPGILGKTATQREIAELRRELAASKETLQSIIEEQEATNEELKSANEEIESSNEELQSTNEELETAKEELQSTNEELTTLNEELSNRNLEMMQLNDDLNNLLASTQLPIVVVDNSLAVHRATPAAREAFNVLQTDIGRPLRELKPNVEIPDLEKILRKVIETLAPYEGKVKDNKDRNFSLRVRPYRTRDNKIDGAVITLVDIDGNKGPRKKA
ncbi:MAG TPA: PAS domain-containing protein [Chthoniobacterales bacterium]